MREVQPEVFCVGETKADYEGVQSFLTDIGVPGWTTDVVTDAEGLVEIFGRNCYRSFEPGLNKNVTKVRQGNKAYLENILRSGHGSVLEHCSANFIFTGVSRVFTHELVRHRVGTAISQESLRFVRLDDIPFWMPPEIAEDPVARQIFEEAVRMSEECIRRLTEHFDLDSLDRDFDYKKRITSALRRIAPEGLATVIGWSANFRTIRHTISLRTNPNAEPEIRLVFAKLAEFCKARWPNLFLDMESRELPAIDGVSRPPQYWFRFP